jgi:hypothetical protein
MSVHVEWLDATCTVQTIGRGMELPDGSRVEATEGLVLGADDLVVIQGSRKELVALSLRIRDALAFID